MTGQQAKQIAKDRAYQQRRMIAETTLGEEFQERAAIIQYDAKKSRDTAEFEARRQIDSTPRQWTLGL